MLDLAYPEEKTITKVVAQKKLNVPVDQAEPFVVFGQPNQLISSAISPIKADHRTLFSSQLSDLQGDGLSEICINGDSDSLDSISAVKPKLDYFLF